MDREDETAKLEHRIKMGRDDVKTRRERLSWPWTWEKDRAGWPPKQTRREKLGWK